MLLPEAVFTASKLRETFELFEVLQGVQALDLRGL
jgi:hypothetical protein